MTKPPEAIKEIIAEQVVFEDGRTLPKVIEAILERINATQSAEISSASEEGSETNGV